MTGYVSTSGSFINYSNYILIIIFGSFQIEFLSEAQIGGYSFDTVVQVVSSVPYLNSS